MACPYLVSGLDIFDTCELNGDECDGFSCDIPDEFEDDSENDFEEEDYPF